VIPLPIETRRLVVRAFDPPADVDAMARVYCDREVMRYIVAGPMETRAEVARALADYKHAQETRGFAFYAVVVRGTGTVIGDVGFGVLQETGDVEIGWTLARSEWGRGYATEAAAATLAAGLVHLKVARIVAAVDRDNPTSLRVAHKLGMREFGEMTFRGRPHVLLEIERADRTTIAG
jgi:RimJ/RimL family protein N-acetyltransferase